MTADGLELYNTAKDGQTLMRPLLVLEAGAAGSLEFDMYKDAPGYDELKRLETFVDVYRDDTWLWRGRVIEDSTNIYGVKNFKCEGLLAVFNDTILRPYEFSGGVQAYLDLILQQHNEQVDPSRQFQRGTVTVTDPNDYIVRADSSYPVTMQVMRDKLVGLLGGYFMARHENGVNYLDYLADGTRLSSQVIELERNVVDYTEERSGAEIVTALLPLGARDKDTGQRLGVASVNGGKDFIQDDEAVAKYGRIMRVEIWDDVTVAGNLLRKARELLADLMKTNISIRVDVVDLAHIDEAVDAFNIMDRVRVKIPLHSIDQTFLVSRQRLNLEDPTQNVMTVGRVWRSLSAMTVRTRAAISNIETNVAALSQSIASVSDAFGDEFAGLQEQYQDLAEKAAQGVEAKRILFGEMEVPEVVRANIVDAVTADIGWLVANIADVEVMNAIQAHLDYAEIGAAIIDRAFIERLVGHEAYLDFIRAMTIEAAQVKVTDSLTLEQKLTNIDQELAGLYDLENASFLWWPDPPYHVDDVWRQPEMTLDELEALRPTVDELTEIAVDVVDYVGGNIYVCTVSRESGKFNRGDWLRVVSSGATIKQAELDAEGLRLTERVDSLDGRVRRTEARQEMADGRLQTVVTDLNSLQDSQLVMLQSQEEWELQLQSALATAGANDEAISAMTQHLRYGAEGLRLGSSDSPMSVLISNEGIDFLDGETPVARITGQQLHIASAVIVQALIIGNHKFEPDEDSNDVTVVRWLGGG